MIASIKDIMLDALDRCETSVELEINKCTLKLPKGTTLRIRQREKPKPTALQQANNARINALIGQWQSTYKSYHQADAPAITTQDRLAVKQQLLRYGDDEANLLIKRYVMSPDLSHIKDRRLQNIGRAMSILTRRRD